MFVVLGLVEGDLTGGGCNHGPVGATMSVEREAKKWAELE